MSGLAKATLTEIRSTPGAEPIGDPVDVQFNPGTLRLSISNEIEGGERSGRQARQYIGSSSTELSFDLVFDTAEEIGDDGTPRSVRERTGAVERFLRPRSSGGSQKQTVPKVRFHWGDLVVDGIIESLSVDFELFSPGGVPLRAKMSVSIKEQDAQYQYLESGPGANEQVAPAAEVGGAASASGGGGSGGARGGGSRGASVDRVAEALAGESLADFAARQGIDPSAWRDMAAGIDDPLSLPAGAEVRFPSAPRSRSPIGSAASPLKGVAEGEGGGGRGGAAAGGGGSRKEELDGRAAAASGGVQAGLVERAAAVAREAAREELEAFGTRAAGGEGGAVEMRSDRANRSAGTNGEGQVDARALSFGLGVPLRPRISVAAVERNRLLRGGATLRPGASPLVVTDPTIPPWEALAAADAGRREANRKQRSASSPCGCSCHTSRPGGGTCRCT